MKTSLLLALPIIATVSWPAAARPPLALDYNIRLTRNTNGLDIAVHAMRGPAVTVGIENRSGRTATCSASFVHYPHRPAASEIRSATVAPGKTATLAYPILNFGGEFSTAFVDVVCKAK